MSKIVKYTEFKSVVDALWGKVKDNFMTITKSSQYVSKVKPNVISEKTVIVDGYIQGNKVSSVNNEPNPRHHMNIGGWFIYEGFKVTANTKVSHITIGVDDTLNVGDMVRGVVVGFAKRIDYAKIRVEKYVMQDGVAFVRNNTDTSLTNCTKVVTIEVNDTVTEDMLLILGCEKAIWGEKDAQTTGLSAGGGLPLVQVGEERPIGYGNWVGKAVVYADGISLKDMSNNITTNSSEIQNINNNKVDRTEVGNVAGKIPVINNSGRLEESIMPDIAITEVRVIARGSEIMNQQNIQTGDVIVVEDEGNKTYMCKNPQGVNKNDRFVEINMGYPVVKEVNNQRPNQTGALDLNATHINATIEGNTKTVEKHLTDIGQGLRNTHNIATSYNPRINKLETKGATTRIGEVIKVWTTNSNDYVDEGCTFLYLGRDRTITTADYPQLQTAWGLTGVNRFTLPRMNDATIRFDNGQKTVPEKYFLCVKKS